MLRNIFRAFLHGLTIVVFCGHTAIPTYATIVHPLDVAALVEASDVVAVGRVISVEEEGIATVDTLTGTARAKRFLATLDADQILKGEPESQLVYFRFVVTEVPSGYRIVSKGQYGIFLLQKTQSPELRESDPFYPFLPAVSGGHLPNGSPLDRVVTMLGEVVTARGSTDSEISAALNGLVTIPARSATEALRHGLEISSGDLQLRIASKLLARNDISGLDIVEKALLHPVEMRGYRFLELAGSLAGLKDPRSVPTLKRLLETSNPNIIKSCAIALRQTGSVDALEPLSHLLNNTDELVRYYATVGMGEITKQDEWTPSFDEFHSREGYYISYWHQWASENLTSR